MSSRPLVVTGASGLLGSNLALTAVAGGRRVVGLAHHNPVHLPGVEMHALDLTRPSSLRELLGDTRPEWVFHCAALTDVDYCEQHPEAAHQLNVGASRFVAEVAFEVGAGLTYISTDAVFRGDRGGYGEEDATGPVNAYARSKLEGERVVRQVTPRHLVVRTTIFGWNARDKTSLSEWVLGRLEGGEEVPGFHDIRFNPLLVNDLAEILLDLAERGATGTVHAAAVDGCSKLEFARTVADVFGHDPQRVRPSSVENVSFRAPRPRDTTLNVERLATWLGRPLPSVREGVERFRALRELGWLERLRATRPHETTTQN